MKIIDFHSHILPGVDHGCDSLETSLGQLELSKRANVDIIIATPHFYPHMHTLASFFKKRERAFTELSARSGVKIIRGAEVLLCDNLQNLDGINSLCIEGTRTLLIELPFSPFKDSYADTVEDLIDDGYKIVLAHAERYLRSSIERLLELGVGIQLNASAVSRLFVKKHIRKWLADGDVVALGSDIHMLDKKSYADLATARKKLGSDFDIIMQKSMEYLAPELLHV